MNTKNDVIQIFGTLMKRPQLLSQTDKYSLSIGDFSSTFERYIFDTIEGLYYNGAHRIQTIDIENALETNKVAQKIYEQNRGHEYLEDAQEFSEENNFDYYYFHLKKLNALQSLQKMGIDIKEFYCEDLTNPKATEINKEFEKLTVNEIFETVKKKILKLEKDYLNDDVSETTSAAEGIEELMADLKTGSDIGMPLQGKITTLVMGGARKGTLLLRSLPSGGGKSRQMVGDACFLAYPFRFNPNTCEWEQKGNCEKVLYIATEQSKKEIQRMILAYLTGINESKFRYGHFTDMENIVIAQAIELMQDFADNLTITQMPSPTNELLKNVVREQVILNDIEYVLFDYVFISPALMSEFKGMAMRNDELLLVLTTTLKNLATELNVFVMSGTQVNANADDNKNIRNEASLAGGRSQINKCDYGFIGARPTNEELGVLEPVSAKYGIVPNLVTDVYKVRAGQWTQVRIWSHFDFGILRKEDLFMTDSRLNVIDLTDSYMFEYEDWESKDRMERLNKLNDRLQSDS